MAQRMIKKTERNTNRKVMFMESKREETKLTNALQEALINAGLANKSK